MTIYRHAKLVIESCKSQGLMLTTAESCTGGMISSALTAIAGSSDVVERCFITYSNEAKHSMLGVSPALLERGAVSEEVARAMAEGALANAPVQIAVSVTGIAGPGGGSVNKPVGLVYLSVAQSNKNTFTTKSIFKGSRNKIRECTVKTALGLILSAVTD